MKTIMTSILILNFCSLASASESENPVLTLQKAAASMTAVNGTNRLPLANALASALQHGEAERLLVNGNCEGTRENSTTRVERCLVTFAKTLPASFQGSCGEFGKGTYFFRFLRAMDASSNYQIRGDVELEISLR